MSVQTIGFGPLKGPDYGTPDSTPPSTGDPGFRPGAGTDSVIGGDLDTPSTAAGSGALAVGNDAEAAGDRSISVGSDSIADADHSTVVGSDAWVHTGATNGTAVGDSANCRGTDTTAIGQGANTNNNGETAVGHNANTNGTDSTAVGSQSQAEGPRSIAMGEDAWVPTFSDDSIAIGSGAIAKGVGNTVVGTDAIARKPSTASVTGAVALGDGAVAQADYQGVVKVNEWEVVPVTGLPSTLAVHDSAGTKHVIGVDASTITYDGTPVGSSGIAVQDENVAVASGVTQLDFQGAGVTAATGTGEVVVTIPGYTDEQARDALGAALVAGTGITVTVNDGADTITITNTVSAYTDEQARDAIGAALVAGTGITITVNDPADTITIASSGTSGITVQDENSTIGSGVTQLDFQGGGVVAAAGTGEVIVTVRGNTCRAISTTQTLLATDEIVLASGTITATLPSVASFVGRRLTIKNTGTGTLTISPASGTIDGAASKTLAVQYSSVDLVTDGTNWFEV